MNIENMIELSREKAVEWLETMNMESLGMGVKRCSSFHDIDKYKGMTLPATYNAANCLALLGYYKYRDDEKKNIIEYINKFQCNDGFYRIPEMKDDEVFKRKSRDYTWEYISFHITNYSMGAIYNLGGNEKYSFKFMDKYMSIDALKKWLDGRFMDDPWMEGNNIVNIASFYIKLMENGDRRAEGLLNYLIEWHEKTQDPNTGYWGTNLKETPASQLFGMAGAAHNFHIYYYMNKPIRYIEKIVDYCIPFSNQGISSACLDVDVVDILANMLVYGYRKQDILDCLEKKLIDLLKFQNSDGGFCDLREGTRGFDGWVKGYKEPQGISNCFATWFRMATIGIICCILFPEKKSEWVFRNTIGIGYYNKDYSPAE